MVIIFVTCVFSCGLFFHLIGYRKIKMSKLNQSVHSFWTPTVIVLYAILFNQTQTAMTNILHWFQGWKLKFWSTCHLGEGPSSCTRPDNFSFAWPPLHPHKTKIYTPPPSPPLPYMIHVMITRWKPFFGTMNL